MDSQIILSHVDHTLLSATASWPEIANLCADARTFKTACACIPPSYVRRAIAAFPRLTICTVIGFPLGYSVSKVKVAEAETAINDGARELDMVVNLSNVKNGYYRLVTAEIQAIKKIAGDAILKVIIETCYLSTEEKIDLCECVTEGGADFIKTSTGFGPAGAALDDIRLFREHIGKGVRIKAAGGIRSREAMEAYLEAGCDRLGTSAAIKLLADTLSPFAF